MENEQTNKTDTARKKADKSVENNDESLSIVDEAKKVRDEIKSENDRREEILKKEQKLAADKLLAGTGGGHVDAPVVSPEDKKINNAKEFFKGTALGDAISKVNE